MCNLGGRAYPDMSEGRAEGLLTVSTEYLSGDGGKGHGDTDEAVLEYTEPDNLRLLAEL